VLLHLQAPYPGTDPLAVLTGLTSLIYGNNDPGRADAVWAIAQLTQLRRLELKQPSTFTEIQLAQLSALSRLTCLELNGGVFVAGQPHVASVSFCSRTCLQLHDAWAVALLTFSPAQLTWPSLLSMSLCTKAAGAAPTGRQTGRQNQNMTGSWLAALAAAQVPLRSLTLHPAIMAGELLLLSCPAHAAQHVDCTAAVQRRQRKVTPMHNWSVSLPH
jgi:hypothetical protein